MRSNREPTAKNLLREPLILGVPFVVLISLTILALVGLVFVGDSNKGGLVISIIVLLAYLTARVVQAFAKPGWIETVLFLFEKKGLRKLVSTGAGLVPADELLDVISVDTLEGDDLIAHKSPILEQLSLLRTSERVLFLTEKTSAGIRCKSYPLADPKTRQRIGISFSKFHPTYPHVYTLYALPSATTPLWLYELLLKCGGNYFVFSAFQGLSSHRAKQQIETARRRNSAVSRISNVDSDVAFAEATQVLEGIAKGDDSVVEGSVVVMAGQELDLDPRYFCHEKVTELPLFSIFGVRSRFHRCHILRAVNASDLVLNVGDPHEDNGKAILKTPRGLPLYFNPQDSRLEALHWLVSAASGAGKSFFVGLVLLRLIKAGNKISVLFIDHNRSFRRVTRGANRGDYLEPKSFEDLAGRLPDLVSSLGQVGTLAGVELSDLVTDEKRAAIRILLAEIEKWLRSRDTIHPVYIVLDECWNFMRDEPLLVQRAFREFRKLNGAAIAITQSLSDFLVDESGRAIFQNAPIRILLRQAEDLEPYRGVLGLNDVELKKLRALRQKKGEFSECLIKTPFLSRLGRLYPTEEEHELLRTDNIREEIVRENLSSREVRSAREARC